MVQAVDNTQDIIDSRDVLERIQELQTEESDLDIDNDYDEILELRDELTALEALIEEVRDYSGDSPEDGATLIRDTFFRDYAQELAEEIGAVDSDLSWPLYAIDWQVAANDLQIDYSSVDYNGETYWVRS